MMDGFMQLVKDMRAAQKEYFTARKQWEIAAMPCNAPRLWRDVWTRR